MKQHLIENLPDQPGCYLFKDYKGIIIYVGKAKNLKKRVQSYFRINLPDEKTRLLVEHIHDLTFFVTNSEVEALILENNLIKKHQPKYNIDLKDAKRYAYLELTDDQYPRLVLARKIAGKGKYFGPFVSASARDLVQQMVTKMFKIRTCRKLPKRACLRYHINLCSAPCIQKISNIAYQKDIANAESVLRGKTLELKCTLQQEMQKASEDQMYEYAIDCRNKVDALHWLEEKQAMERQKEYDEDVINFMIKDNQVFLLLFNVRKGILENKQEFTFDYKDDFLEEFMVQYYSENHVPREIILPLNMDTSLVGYLKQMRKKAVRLILPKFGLKKELLDLVKKNIEITFFGDHEKIEDLKVKLRLPDPPEIIECFDISHLAGTATVASMVQFLRSRPNKSQYRRFKIRTVEGIDDFSSIAEVVRRRYTRLISEHAVLPHLIIIDGGRGQLNAALDELQTLGLSIPTISLAKKLEEVYVPGLKKPLQLDKKSKALRLLQEIRDEAHRFAISYNRLLRKKSITG